VQRLRYTSAETPAAVAASGLAPVPVAPAVLLAALAFYLVADGAAPGPAVFRSGTAAAVAPAMRLLIDLSFYQPVWFAVAPALPSSGYL